MRKQTKLVAVLSAAALLALGASMTSFAAGWEKDEAGIWHYYDSDDDMVTGEWKKDGGKWFYLDDDGDMLTDSWVDDDYYVGADGAMLVNQWYKGFGDDEEQDDPDDEGEHWYYFGSRGKKCTEQKKKIGGKTYFFNEDGKMFWGWHETSDGDVYYLGSEDEGWRAENQWLWLEKPSVAHDADNDDDFNVINTTFDCYEDDNCDDEGWYWFQSSGKMYRGSNKKKINGNFFVFNDHGQMLYEWINNANVKLGSNARLDGKIKASVGVASVSDMLWYRENGSDSIDGSRPTGWFKIDGSEDVGTDSDTDWYYIKKGEAKHAGDNDTMGIMDGKDTIYVKREKIDGKYFAFNEKGQMQDGLQYIGGNMYYFNSDGYMQTGKQSNVEEGDDDTYNYYFTTKNSGNGKGYTGEKDGYLYWNGKRLEADDDYKIFKVDGAYYVVNTKGKCQKSNSKKYDVERYDGQTEEKYEGFHWTGKKTYKVDVTPFVKKNACVPHIALKDSWVLQNPDTNAAEIIPYAEKVENDSNINTEFLTETGAKDAIAKYGSKSTSATAEDGEEEGWE
jgi:glucan-binding YG repeat protein